MKKFKSYFSIHYSFIILFIASMFTGLTGLLAMYFVCLVLHEIFHALVAKKLGYAIGRIKLLATGAVLEAESDEFSFSDEILIALSGPLFNLCFSLLIVVFWWLIPESFNITQDLCVINLAIFGFNMLPIFPLDGGRVLLAILSKHTERKTAVSISKAITISLSILLFIVFLISLFISANFGLGMMSVTLFIGGITEDKSAVYKRAFYKSRKVERTKKRGLEVRYIYINEETSNTKLYRLLDCRHYTIFVLVDENMYPKRYLSETALVELITGKN